MAILPFDPATGVATEPLVANTLTDNIIDAVKAPFMTQDAEVMDASGVFWVSAVWGFAGSVAGGMIARKRADKDPILKFLY